MDILYIFRQVMGTGEKINPLRTVFGMDVERILSCNKKDAPN